MTIIGLGNTGCNIAEKFESLEGFKVLLVDANIEGEDNCISINECDTPEQYESTFPDISEHLKKCDDEIVLIVGGSGKISGASLSLLKQIKEKKINVVYVRPDKNSIKNDAKLQDRLVFNVLQEYARSGIFESCFLIDNVNIEKIVGDLPIIGFFDKINELIFSTVSSILLFKQKKPVMNNLTKVKNFCRVRTVGIFNLFNEEEKLLYNIEGIDNKHYHFVINEEKLKTDITILKKIKEYIEENSKDGTDCSFAIYSTKDEFEYCYMDVYSKRIQE